MKALEYALLVFLIGLAASLAVRNAPMSPPPVTPLRLSPFEAGAPAPAGGARAISALPFDSITRTELAEHVRVLAGDAMEGRRTGEPGAERAAAYIEAEFRRIGLRAGGDEGSCRQRFRTRIGARMGEENSLLLVTPGGPIAPALGTDWRPLAFSTRKKLRAAVTFCGYGITSTDPPYDDYAGQDVRGRVVLLLRLEPGAGDPASPFAGTALTSHADLRTKAKNAFDHGAAGVLVVNGPAAPDELLPFDAGAEAGSGHLPAAQVRLEALRLALAALAVDLGAAQAEIDRATRPHSFPLDLTVAMQIEVEPVEAEASNVIGILRGSDPDLGRKAIVAGAHYDHLGRGGRGSLAPDSAAIHNGADDNASGVAALIEIAEALATSPGLARRTVVFAAFTGEEMGLLGSTYYVEHPAWPLAATEAMLNLDMIGRGVARQVLVGGVGTSPGFTRLVEEEARADFLVPVFNEGGFGPSDHTSFYSKDIPVLFFFTQPHADYHRPTDDWEKIDFFYLEATARFIFRVAGRLAGEGQPIQFTRADSGSRPGRAGGGEGYGAHGYGPYLGTVPDFAPSPDGVRLSGVKEGSPAAAAGLQKGDVIVGWNGRSILNLQDYAAALRAQRPGDRVELDILRGGERQTAAAVLGQRP